MSSEELALTSLDARTVHSRLARGQHRPEHLLEACLQRHAAVDGVVNALPTLCPDRARRFISKAATQSPLHGMPVAVKDMTRVSGVRTTFGSGLFADHVPTDSDHVVSALEKAGGVVWGKTNTPEFACGGVTFNTVFGETRNPWNLAYTAGGSSGGSAAAVASGQAWLALGTDFGGSLRIPASFCGIVGFRPSPGMLPRGPTDAAFDREWIEGPMGRTVADTRLLFNALRSRQWRDPLSFDSGRLHAVSDSAGRESPRVRIASVGSMGMGNVEPKVNQSVDDALARIQRRLGWTVAAVELDLSPTRELFAVRRGLYYIAAFDELRRRHPGQIRSDIVRDLERGLEFSAREIALTEKIRGELWTMLASLFERYDVLVSPTVAVTPFRTGQPPIENVAGEPLPTYYDWLRLTYSFSMLGVPALSIPCGLTPEGLPIGMQIVGRPYADDQVLDVAERIEACLDVYAGTETPWNKPSPWGEG